MTVTWNSSSSTIKILSYYWYSAPSPGAPRVWTRSEKGPITNKAKGPGSIIQRPRENGDFEVIVLESSTNGTVLAHYSRDNSIGERKWTRRNNISNSAIG